MNGTSADIVEQCISQKRRAIHDKAGIDELNLS